MSTRQRGQNCGATQPYKHRADVRTYNIVCIYYLQVVALPGYTHAACYPQWGTPLVRHPASEAPASEAPASEAPR